MDAIIELPSSKIINLDRFTVLLPNEDRYSLILTGCDRQIEKKRSHLKHITDWATTSSPPANQQKLACYFPN